MAIAALRNIQHEFESLHLLRGLNLEVSKGERVALVGANGSGKTTIFRILARHLAPTRGEVFWRKGLQVGYLPQQSRLETDQTVAEVARGPFAELGRMERRLGELSGEMAEAGGKRLGRLMAEYGRLEARHAVAGGFAWEHRVEEVLAGVGFAPADRDKSCCQLSGGEQGRLALAGLLLGEADLLLLDEPTNHLDLEAVQWLEHFLGGLPAAVVMVSHDRYFLDRLASKVYELSGGATESYPGNYSNYLQERGIRRLHRQRQFEKDQAYIAKERNFVARFHASGSRSREARGRATRLARQLNAGEFITEADRGEKTLSLRMSAQSRGSNLAVRMADVSKAFGEQKIVEALTFDLYSREKMAILGPNGVGKTTVLRMALGLTEPDAGQVKVGKGMTVGHYDQKQSGLDDSLTVLAQMRAFTGEAADGPLRALLARFLFRGEEVFKPVAALSGGERSRLLLARLLYQRPNFLVLDEPTNHLDIPSREALETALGQYDGTVLLVSHDRYFVDRVCSRLLLLWPDRWELVAGNYSHWQMLLAEKAERRRAAEKLTEATAAAKPRRAGPAGGAKAGGKAGEARTVGGLNSYQLGKLTLKQVEDQIHKAERKLKEVEESFSTPEVFGDPDALAAAQQNYQDLRTEIDGLMEVWQVKMDEQGGEQ